MKIQMTSPPAWSMIGRYAKRAPEKSPGPGAYDPSLSNLSSSPKYGMGSGRRFDFEAGRTPGPGAYSSSISISGPQFSLKGKYNTSRGDKKPGPGAYNTELNDFTKKNRPSSAKIGTAKRTEHDSDAVKHGFPGPGRYEAPVEQNTPSHKFGTAKRGDRKRKLTPGPGTYDVFNHSSSGTVIGSSQRRSINERPKTPGPGTYNIPLRIEGVGWTMQGRYRSRNPDLVPGPYDTSKKIGGPQWSFGTERKFERAKNCNPGPGTYEFRSSIADVPSYVVSCSRSSSRIQKY